MPGRTVAQLLPPLSGASVIVTRPAGSAAALLRRLRVMGASAVALPGLSLRKVADAPALQRALGAAARADGVVFMSPAAVRFAWQLRPSLRFLRRVRVCAVGAATAAALRRRGVAEVAVPSTRQDSEGVLALDALHGVRGQQWLLIGAPGGRDALASGLRRRRAKVALLAVYERAAPRWTRQHYARLETAPKPHIVLVSSAQALATLATALPPGLVLALRTAELVVSSARLAALARDHGFSRVHVAESALSRDLIVAAIRALARHRL